MFIDTATANTRSARPYIVVEPDHVSSHCVSPHHTSPYNDSQTPLVETFINQDAPPSYLEATTPGLYTGRLSGEEGARLLSFDGREPRDTTFKEEQYRRRRLRDQCLKKRWLKGIAAIVVVVAISALGALALAAVTARRNAQIAATTPVSSAQASEDELSHPDGFIDDDSDKTDLVAIPSSSVQPKQLFPIRWPSKCGKEYNVKTEEYDFGQTKELNIQEALHQLDGQYKRVAGWIHIASAPASQTPGTITVKMSYAVSPSVNINSIRYISTATGLTIGDPSFSDGFDSIRPDATACLGLSIVLYMAPAASLNTLNISSTHMGMQIHTGVDLTVKTSTSIALTTGTLDAASFPSRQTYLTTTSGSISGAFALDNALSVSTTSGSVSIAISPIPASFSSSSSSTPALLSISTLSGSIRADVTRTRIPTRDYQTHITTTVGAVHASLIHGSLTNLTSTAGALTADIMPFTSSTASTLRTHTQSGLTTLVLSAPYGARGTPLTGLLSTHTSVVGGLDVVYPEEWEGVLVGRSGGGAVRVRGRELVLVGEEEREGERMVEAKKGEGKGGGRMVVESGEGECGVRVGEV